MTVSELTSRPHPL